jgi:hypothetical protein
VLKEGAAPRDFGFEDSFEPRNLFIVEIIPIFANRLGNGSCLTRYVGTEEAGKE